MFDCKENERRDCETIFYEWQINTRHIVTRLQSFRPHAAVSIWIDVWDGGQMSRLTSAHQSRPYMGEWDIFWFWQEWWVSMLTLVSDCYRVVQCTLMIRVWSTFSFPPIFFFFFSVLFTFVQCLTVILCSTYWEFFFRNRQVNGASQE